LNFLDRDARGQNSNGSTLLVHNNKPKIVDLPDGPRKSSSAAALWA
jgi:hypothetical protein